MQEIVKLVSEKTGISPETAAKAVEVIAGYVRSKMPAVGGQIDSLLKGGGRAEAGVTDNLPDELSDTVGPR